MKMIPQFVIKLVLLLVFVKINYVEYIEDQICYIKN